ncbi:MAG: alpha/beta hydrolase [Nitrososphaerota archaeon]|nr:alpha/beta hydrolase [Nitrososphaerota archaeon]
MPKIEVNGAQLYYELNGDGDPVVLVHGMSSDHEEWKYQVPELSKFFKVITCDLRGHGESSKEESNKFTVELFADDLDGLLKQLGFSKVHLVGHSLGGEVACCFAVKHPQMLKTLVLMGEPASSPPGFAFLPLMLKIFSLERIAKMSAPRLLHSATEEKIQMLVKSNKRAGKATVSADAKLVRSFRLPQELSSLSVPTLLVYGETDMMKKDVEAVQKAVPNSRLVFIPKAGHLMQIDNPDEFNKALLEFLLSHKQR